MDRPPASESTTTSSEPGGARRPLVLKKGSRGDAVVELQKKLSDFGHSLEIDGSYGPDTDRAVRRFQADRDLHADGIVGPDTWRALGGIPFSEASEAGPKTKMAAEEQFSDSAAPEQAEQAEHAEQGGADEALDAEDDDRSDAGAEAREDEDDRTAPGVRPVAVNDRAASLEEDQLGFVPHVRAIVDFLCARQTEPPINIAVTAGWGEGKSSLMQMVDELLPKKRGAPRRFATAWFNPWKFSEPRQVWGSYVGVVASCIRGALGPRQRCLFEIRRFLANIRDRTSFALLLRVVVALSFAAAAAVLIFDGRIQAAGLALVQEHLGENLYKALAGSYLGQILPAIASLVLISYLYTRVVRHFNLDLLGYLRTTGYQEKVGTLVDFEREMRQLTQAMPEKLHVVIFIDDLDRCSASVLHELIQALQHTSLAQRSFNVLGMDLRIVAETISSKLQQLSNTVRSESNGLFQNGKGYQFLEKIIQARVTLPGHGEPEIAQLLSGVLGPLAEHPTGPDAELVGAGALAIGEPVPADAEREREQVALAIEVEDDPRVTRKLLEYGPHHFSNPRRLKRFVNNYRLQVLLAPDLAGAQLDLVTRFLILAEKWPGAVDLFVTNEGSLARFLQGERLIELAGDDWADPDSETEGSVRALLEPAPQLDEAQLHEYCRRFGFQFYAA